MGQLASQRAVAAAAAAAAGCVAGGCGERGYCDTASRVCVCQPGLHGPQCAESYFPACRLVDGGDDDLIRFLQHPANLRLSLRVVSDSVRSTQRVYLRA